MDALARTTLSSAQKAPHAPGEAQVLAGDWRPPPRFRGAVVAGGGWVAGRMEGRTDGWMDGRMDG